MTVPHVDDLMNLSDELFVEVLYRDVLGRSPDIDGRRHYLNLIRLGTRKATIIEQVALSAEGRRCNIVLPGLPEFLAAERKERQWVRRLFGRGRRMERHLHRLENELGRVTQMLQAMKIEQVMKIQQVVDNPPAAMVPLEHSPQVVIAPVVPAVDSLPFSPLRLTRRSQEILGRLVF